MNPRLRYSLLHGLFLLSGFCGLGYQLVWIRMFAFGLGHETPAMLAVVGAFFGGLAVGAWALDRAIARSAFAYRWYAALEALIGVWGLLSVILIPQANHLALAAIGLEPSPWCQWTVSFVMPFVTLLPATAAMGATLPAMERFVRPLNRDGRCVAALYAVNTFGAVGGTWLGALWIVPWLGFRGALCLFAVLNLSGAAAALALGTAVLPSPARESLAPPVSPRRLAVLLLLTGWLGIGFEVVGVRVLGRVLENTVFTFAATLATFLLGTTLGSGLAARFGRRFRFDMLVEWLLCGLALACMAEVWVLARSTLLYEWCRLKFGEGLGGTVSAEAVVAATVFAVPSLGMGAVFSLLAQAASGPSGGLGRALAVNTLGGALAPLSFGIVMLPALGAKWAMVIVAVGYFVASRLVWRGFSPAAGLGLAGLVGLALVSPADLRLLQLPPEVKVLSYREGSMDAVAVLATPDGHRSLELNNRFMMGGTSAANAERRHFHLPLLLHPAPRHALFLGAGTGISFSAAAAYPDLVADAVELVPEVAQALNYFAPENARGEWAPRLRLVVADARRFIRVTTNRYDVIVADLFHPARDGAGALYTREHFQALRDHLLPGGLACQWLPLYQLDQPTLATIVRTFLAVFPDTRAYLLRLNLDTPVLGLIGNLEPRRYPPDWFDRRVGEADLQEQLKPLSLTDSLQLFGCLVAGPQALETFSKAAELNTDNRPLVMFQAPRALARRDANTYDRLFALLALHGADPDQLIAPGPDAKEFVTRLEGWLAARDVYLKGLLAENQGQTAQAIEAFLQSARLSADFSTGYAQCLALAVQESKSRPQAARELLERLIEAQPARPVARELLQRLFGP